MHYVFKAQSIELSGGSRERYVARILVMRMYTYVQ